MLSYDPSCIERIHDASRTLNVIEEMAISVLRLFRHKFRQARMKLVFMVLQLSLLSKLSYLSFLEKEIG